MKFEFIPENEEEKKLFSYFSAMTSALKVAPIGEQLDYLLSANAEVRASTILMIKQYNQIKQLYCQLLGAKENFEDASSPDIFSRLDAFENQINNNAISLLELEKTKGQVALLSIEIENLKKRLEKING